MTSITNFNKAFNLSVYALFASLLLIFTSCDEDDPVAEDVPETITTVQLTFTPDGGGAPVVAQSYDADGEGPGNPEVDDIVLVAGTTYTLSVALYNELLEPSDDEYNITNEVDEESDEHQFFYQFTPASLFSGNFQYNDQDENGLPVGLSTTWTTAAAGTGSFTVILKHQPGLKSESSDTTVGETDVQQAFNLTIQ